MTGQLMLDAFERSLDRQSAATWATEVRRQFAILIDRGLPFTATDLWDALPEDLAVGRVNLIGELFKEAARAGRIRRSGRWEQSDRPSRRGGVIAIWHPVTT